MAYFRKTKDSVFEAKYAGKCKICGEPIHIGSYITGMRVGRGVRHPQCREQE